MVVHNQTEFQPTMLLYIYNSMVSWNCRTAKKNAASRDPLKDIGASQYETVSMLLYVHRDHKDY